MTVINAVLLPIGCSTDYFSFQNLNVEFSVPQHRLFFKCPKAERAATDLAMKNARGGPTDGDLGTATEYDHYM